MLAMQNEEQEFYQSLNTAARALLADSTRMQQLCEPAACDDESIVGVHLRAEQVQVLHAEILVKCQDVAESVFRALSRKDPQIPDRDRVQAVNTTLNEAVGNPNEIFETRATVTVEAGLIDAARDIFADAKKVTREMYKRFTKAGPDFNWLFNLHIVSDVPDESMLVSLGKLFSILGKLEKVVRKFNRMVVAHDGSAINADFESREKLLRTAIWERDKIQVDELFSRSKILLDDFQKIIACLSALMPAGEFNATAELAVHYFQTVHVNTNNLVRLVLKIENETEEPGLFYTPGPNSQAIYLSYAERLSIFLDSFKAVIVAMNVVERTLLLMECKPTE